MLPMVCGAGMAGIRRVTQPRPGGGSRTWFGLPKKNAVRYFFVFSLILCSITVFSAVLYHQRHRQAVVHRNSPGSQLQRLLQNTKYRVADGWRSGSASGKQIDSALDFASSQQVDYLVQQQPRLAVAVDRPFDECCPYDQAVLPMDRSEMYLPKLMGIGVHKAGTTYLFNLMELSRYFMGPMNGEKELFTMAQWPLQPSTWVDYLNRWNQTTKGKLRQRFEITATYLHMPGTACRVAKAFPHMKFVAVLRDPVERALSHYNMWIYYYKMGVKQTPLYPFNVAVSREIAQLRKTGCSFESDTGNYARTWQSCFRCSFLKSNWTEHHSTCAALNLHQQARGMKGDTPCSSENPIDHFTTYAMYAAPLRWWFRFFGPDRFLLITSSELKKDPVDVANRVSRFMMVPEEHTQEMVDSHARELDGNPFEYIFDNNADHIQAGRKLLTQFFAPHVLDLYHLLEQQHIPFAGFENFPPGGEWQREWEARGPPYVPEAIDNAPYRTGQWARSQGITIGDAGDTVVWQNRVVNTSSLVASNNLVQMAHDEGQQEEGAGRFSEAAKGGAVVVSADAKDARDVDWKAQAAAGRHNAGGASSDTANSAAQASDGVSGGGSGEDASRGEATAGSISRAGGDNATVEVGASGGGGTGGSTLDIEGAASVQQHVVQQQVEQQQVQQWRQELEHKELHHQLQGDAEQAGVANDEGVSGHVVLSALQGKGQRIDVTEDLYAVQGVQVEQNGAEEQRQQWQQWQQWQQQQQQQQYQHQHQQQQQQQAGGRGGEAAGKQFGGLDASDYDVLAVLAADLTGGLDFQSAVEGASGDGRGGESEQGTERSGEGLGVVQQQGKARVGHWVQYILDHPQLKPEDVENPTLKKMVEAIREQQAANNWLQEQQRQKETQPLNVEHHEVAL